MLTLRSRTLTSHLTARHYAIADVNDLTHPVQERQQQSGSRSARSGVAGGPSELPTSRPTKRKRANAPARSSGVSSPLVAHGPASSSHAAAAADGPPSSQSPPQQPRVSLARLPLDVLLRIGELLLPLPVARTVPSSSPSSLTAANAGEATRSPAWLDYGVDLVDFSSTCRAAWAATRHLVGRSYGCDVRTVAQTHGAAHAAQLVMRRLEGIVADGEEYDEAVAGARKRDAKGKRRDDELVSRGERPLAAHEFVPASRVRHLFLALSGDASIFNLEPKYDILGNQIGPVEPLAELLAAKLALLTNLESLALVWKDERTVVSTTPYDLVTVPADVLTAVTAHPTLRDLFACGLKWSRRFCDGSPIPDLEADDPAAAGQFRFRSPRLRSLTLNASHDSCLELVTMAAPGVREVRAWRDFTRAPRTAPEFWWNQEAWKTVERVEMTGFSSEQGEPLLLHMLAQLLTLRSGPTPPTPPLHTLRLTEPYSSSTLWGDLLPLLVHLPHLRDFTVFVWNDRSFGPRFLQSIADVVPDLEELGVGLESEGLNWWQGSLTEYAAVLKKFSNLRTFTWNYSPYADLDYPETRKHVLPFLHRSLVHASYSPPSFTALHWFGQPIHLRRISSSPSASSAAATGAAQWKWSDDPVFERRVLPRWAEEKLRTKEEWERERRVGEWMGEWGSLGAEGEEEEEDEDEGSEEEEEGSEEDGESASEASSEMMDVKVEPGSSNEDEKDDGNAPAKRRRTSLNARRRAAESQDKEKENRPGVPLSVVLARASAASSASTSQSTTALSRATSVSNSAPASKPAPRKSIGELLAAAKKETVKEGKAKAKAREEGSASKPLPAAFSSVAGRKASGSGKGGAGAEEEDWGFWEMEVADL
ncbi:hypothetical protein JCM6882_007078 [Rhodosporidiobolus microsporus]